MTRDQVIECAKDWIDLCSKSINVKFCDAHQEHEDVLCACIDLAFNRTKEALVVYAKEREAEFAAHDRMLETIEQTLRGDLSNGV